MVADAVARNVERVVTARIAHAARARLMDPLT